MRKNVTDLVETLRTSVLGIYTPGVENPEDLLRKSFGEFDASLQSWIDERYGEDLEPLAKGLNHISAFAQALNRMNQVVNAIKTGRPGYMIDSDGGQPAEPVVAETSESLDRFMRVGIFTLRGMVNDTAELPEDEADLERAEQAGNLVKIETDHGDLLIKSELPADLCEYFTDPLELMVEGAAISREMTDDTIALAEDLLKSENGIPDEVIDACPEIFAYFGHEDSLNKLFPPPRKKPAAGGGQAAGGQAAGGDDETVGDGGDPNDDAPEPTGADAGADGGSSDITDDTPQNPLEMIARLSSIIVVIAGSLLQGQGQGDGTDATAGNAADNAGTGAMSDDSRNVGLQRGEPIADVPLAKILSGDVEVDPTVADALEELLALRKRLAEFTTADGDLKKLRETVARLEAMPAPAIGAQRVVAVDKSSDIAAGMNKGVEVMASEVERLSKSDPNSAAKLLIAAAHAGGGRPLVPGS